MTQRQTQGIKGQAVIEIAVFGAIVIFLIGVILRAHISASVGNDHQARALKLALQTSSQHSMGHGGRTPNSSRNVASILFIEDRLSPDFNKYNTIDRFPLVASGSGGLSNRLQYPIDFVTYGNEPFGEIGYNLPIMDIYVNGQHFPITTAGYVLRILYKPTDVCPEDTTGENSERGPEYTRCLRQKAEMDGAHHVFYELVVNGTQQYNATASNATFDLLRNNWDTHATTIRAGGSIYADDVPGCVGTRGVTGVHCTLDADCPGSTCDTLMNSCRAPQNICSYFTWQWRKKTATPAALNADVPESPTDVVLGLGTEDNPNYPGVDTSGSLRQQTIYAVTQRDLSTIMADTRLRPFFINGNPNLIALSNSLTQSGYYNFANPYAANYNPLGLTRNPSGASPITGVVVLDAQLGDMDTTYDPNTSPGPQTGLMQDMRIYTLTKSGSTRGKGTYLQIKEGKLYNPETGRVVRSVSSKDHVDVISRQFQLSNNTGRFCQIHCPPPASSWNDSCYVRPATLADQYHEPNPVEICSDFCETTYPSNTCYSPKKRILFIRTKVGDVNRRKWFTDVTKGL
jgi:hypothetical protein